MLAVYAQYPTFTVFLAVFLGALVTMVLMPFWIRGLKKHLIGQQVRADGPESHLVKQGTPTMGGVVMLVAMAITVFLLAAPELDTTFIMLAIILTGVLGLIDDASKVAKERSLGLTPKAKLIGQFLISTAFVLAVVNWLGVAPTIDIPFVATLDFGILTTTLPFDVPAGQFSIPWLYLIFCDILLMGLSNATNLTDGLDGLAAGTVMMAILVMAAIAYRLGMLDAALVGAAIAGCCIGFLWFNAYPADIFMGDTGSLALGMALGCIAIVTKTEVISLIIGGLFRHDPGVLLQAHEEALVPHGAASSSFREARMERSEGGRAFLDHLGMLRCCRILYLLRPNDGSLETGIICPSERKDRP